MERRDHLSADSHATDVFDVAPGHWLAVSNDGERLEDSTRISGGLLGVQAVQEDAHLGTTLKTPTRGDRDQFDPPALPVGCQLVQDQSEGVSASLAVEQLLHLLQGQRAGGTDQGSFEDAFDLFGVHA